MKITKKEAYMRLNNAISKINSNLKVGTDTIFTFTITESTVELFKVKHYYGGEGYQVGRGAWFEKSKVKVFTGKGSEAEAFLLNH